MSNRRNWRTMDGVEVREGDEVWIFEYLECDPVPFVVGRHSHLLKRDGGLTVHRVYDAYSSRRMALIGGIDRAREEIRRLQEELRDPPATGKGEGG
jgi:hypothetical protein